MDSLRAVDPLGSDMLLLGVLRNCNCKMKTTGRGLMAGRRLAPGGLFGVREPAQGVCDR